MVSLAVFDSNADHGYAEFENDACETVRSAYGTGGGNMPIVVEKCGNCVYAFDPYNSSVTKKMSSIGVNCGMSTGRSLIVIDMTHANDVVRMYDDGTVPTLQNRMGTGGGESSACCFGGIKG